MHDQFKIDFNEEKVNSDKSVVEALKYLAYLAKTSNKIKLHTDHPREIKLLTFYRNDEIILFIQKGFVFDQFMKDIGTDCFAKIKDSILYIHNAVAPYFDTNGNVINPSKDDERLYYGESENVWKNKYRVKNSIELISDFITGELIKTNEIVFLDDMQEILPNIDEADIELNVMYYLKLFFDRFRTDHPFSVKHHVTLTDLSRELAKKGFGKFSQIKSNEEYGYPRRLSIEVKKVVGIEIDNLVIYGRQDNIVIIDKNRKKAENKMGAYYIYANRSEMESDLPNILTRLRDNNLERNAFCLNDNKKEREEFLKLMGEAFDARIALNREYYEKFAKEFESINASIAEFIDKHQELPII
jgi:hypothetical protein